MKKKKLLENINHQTKSRPFSIHQTHIDEGNENALYLHNHAEVEFLYLIDGELDFYVEELKFTMHSGDGIFIPPYLVHHAVNTSSRPCDFSAIVFSEKWLLGNNDYYQFSSLLTNNRFDCIHHIDSSQEENLEVLQILSKYKDYKTQPIDSYELRLKGELMICFQYLYSVYFSKNILSGDLGNKKNEILTCIDYMNDNYMKKLTVEQLANITGYSVSHFDHKFKEYTGTTPIEYLNRIRLINAADMLVNSSVKITVVANDCGFDNISYFNRCFKKVFNVSPGEYKKLKL